VSVIVIDVVAVFAIVDVVDVVIIVLMMQSAIWGHARGLRILHIKTPILGVAAIATASVLVVVVVSVGVVMAEAIVKN
jgi:hypothetical protein